MSYYKTQMIVFDKIDQQIKNTIANGSNLNIKQMVLDLTRNYPVSPKAVENRIKLYVEVNKDHIMILDGEVMLK